GQVHVDDLLPACERRLLRPRAPDGAGVVDEHVDAAELRARPLDDRLDLALVANVAPERERPTPVGAQLLGRPLAAVEVAGAEDEIGARLGERLGHLAADAGAAAGDDRDPAGQVEELARPQSPLRHRQSRHLRSLASSVEPTLTARAPPSSVASHDPGSARAAWS